jgi:hypothetical protein
MQPVLSPEIARHPPLGKTCRCDATASDIGELVTSPIFESRTHRRLRSVKHPKPTPTTAGSEADQIPQQAAVAPVTATKSIAQGRTRHRLAQ